MEGSSFSGFEGKVLHQQDLTLLGDGAQTVDLLGYQPYVDALCEVLAQERLQTPFAVGVFGRWGTGKSTFMNLLRNSLSLDARQGRGDGGGFHTVFFQPWQFEEKEEVWKALLLSVIRYLEVVQARRTTVGAEQAERIKQTLAELAVSVGKLALNKTIQTMTSGVLDLDQVLDAYAKTARDNSLFINTFREKFGELKEEILTEEAGDVPRLFVFVDDLDRCTPDNCIMVLEAIKLFFDLPECVFILGIDREVVQRGIEQKYRQNLGIHGQDYIDKLIQLPFSLPPIRKETFENFVQSITGDFHFSPEIQTLIVHAAEGNPRLAKRLSNCLQLTRTVANRLFDSADKSLLESIGTLDEAKLALLLTLQVRYPVAYLWLTQNPKTLQELEEGWRARPSENPESSGDGEGYRQRIARFLHSAYGDRVAEQNTDGFFRLWRFAENSEYPVSPFANRQELQAYMRVTGIVDEGRAFDAAKEPPPTAKETIDSAFLGPEEERVPEDDTVVAGDSGGQVLSTGNKVADRAVIAQRAEQLKQQAQDIDERWQRYSREGILKAPLVLPRLRSRANRLVEDAERAIERIDELIESPANLPLDAAIDLRDLRSDLASIDEPRAYRHIIQVASAFTFIWPLSMLALGWLSEFTLKSLSDLSPGGASKAEVPGGLSFLIDRLLAFDSERPSEPLPIDYLLSAPLLFPGGPLFFWAAIVYTVVAAGICFRAWSHVRY